MTQVKSLLKKGGYIPAQKDDDCKGHIFQPMQDHREELRGKAKGSWWSVLSDLTLPCERRGLLSSLW